MPTRRLPALADPSDAERTLLGAFRYSRNLAVLHTDETFMPKRRAVWSSWNYLGSRRAPRDQVCVTYWMNLLQNIDSDRPLFVTLNPPRAPRAGTLLHSEIYEHPLFDAEAMAAQRKLWLLQGQRNTWFCGAYFGAGFHEDGLQAGLAVAEQLGGLRRPWKVPNESGRIVLTAKTADDRRTGIAVMTGAFVALYRIGDAPAASSATASLPLSRVLAAARSRRARSLRARLRWFSYNRRNVFSLYDRDHGDGSATPLRVADRKRGCGMPASNRRWADRTALHAAHARLWLQSAEHLLLLSRGRLRSPR